VFYALERENPDFGHCLFYASTFYVVIRAQKYDGNLYDENGKLRKGAWKQLVIPGAICVVTLIFVAVVMYFHISRQE